MKTTNEQNAAPIRYLTIAEFLGECFHPKSIAYFEQKVNECHSGYGIKRTWADPAAQARVRTYPIEFLRHCFTMNPPPLRGAESAMDK